MFLGLTEEQQLLKDSFTRLFGKESTLARVRAALPLGFDSDLWSELVALSVPVMRVPEAAGGLSLSLLDTAIVAEVAGRHLASAPIAEVAVSARVLAECGPAGEEWLARLADGSAIVVPALQPIDAQPRQLVAGGAIADAVIGLDGDELVLIAQGRHPPQEANIAGLPLAWCELAGGTRTVLLEGARARVTMQAAVEEWRILTASLISGLSRQMLQLAADYARERTAFGRPIGSFQGLAHPLADALTDVEAGRLMVLKAIAATAAGAGDAGGLVALTWHWVSEAATAAARRSLRALGGYGLSLEYDMHLYHRRAVGHVLNGGDPQEILALAGNRLFAGEGTALPPAGECAVSFGLSDEAGAFRQRVADFIVANQTPEMLANPHHSTASHDPAFHRGLAREGLIYTGWPTDVADPQAPIKNYVAHKELEAAGYTTHLMIMTEMVAKVVERFATEEARLEILPRLKQGEAVCGLGFSEPGSGSDVFAAQTQAARTDDGWLINGQKMFTTGGHKVDYIMLLTRSEPGSVRHKGLTLFIVPTSLPGYSFQPVHTYQDERTNITFYTDMAVPDRYRLGEAGEGVSVMGAALGLEHGAAGAMYHGQVEMMKAALRWARTAVNGVAPLDRPAIRTRFATIMARLEASHAFVARDLWAADAGIEDRSFGPMSKMFVTEAHLTSAWEIMEMAGLEGSLTGNHDLGIVELGHRRAYGSTIYGGTSEVHRSLVAEQGLGLPKSRS